MRKIGLFVLAVMKKMELKTVNPMGLVMGHAYAVIDTKEVTSRRGKEQILQIRNPWGNQEWKGDWSDSSDLWTPQLKKQCGWSNSDDGTFWIPFEDFAQYFVNVTICRVHDNYYYEGLHHTQGQGQFAVYKVTLSKPGSTYFITTQVDERRFNEEDGYQFSPARIIVGKLNQRKQGGKGRRLTFISGFCDIMQRDIWTMNELEVGTYLVYVQMDWIQDVTEDYGFSVYSESPVKLEDVTFQEKNFLYDVYTYNLAKQTVDPSLLSENIYFYEVERLGPGEDGKCMEGIMFDVIRNKSEDLIIELEVLHKSLENVELVGIYEGKDSYKIKLKPEEKKVVVKRQVILTEEIDCRVTKTKKIIAI
ncbi:unnamed protein product [Blepharisma stoltei]|uniref:Calpain catalytic domain-containing protein n=1 Tax=Blepharisma stoltei TaxID=1481888 RepID=A0AAU9ITW4_9CILI|nr:unnamed protein product [Blepharisma stoltei]